MCDAAAHAIRLEDHAVFFGGKALYSGLFLSLSPGAKVTLCGPSGSGKSTLLRCIMGFVPSSKGAVHILGQRLDEHSVWSLRGSVTYVAQEPELGAGSVREALMRPFHYRANRDLRYDEKQALALFERFLVPHSLLNAPLSSLSGGEKQRVALVSALLLDRPVLLLDEVSSALDGKSKSAVRDYLCAQAEVTILSVSHDVRDFALSGPVLDMDALKAESATGRGAIL